jgi:hypothetical protein
VELALAMTHEPLRRTLGAYGANTSQLALDFTQRPAVKTTFGETRKPVHDVRWNRERRDGAGQLQRDTGDGARV